MGNTVADGSNGILRNTKITVPLKQLGTFCGLLEMYFINYKVELKLKWTEHCVLSAVSAVNADANSNKDRKLRCERHKIICPSNHIISKMQSKTIQTFS